MRITKHLWLALALLAALSSTACSSSNTTKPFSELLVLADQFTLNAVDASGNALEQVASATIPGVPGTYSRAGTTVTVTIPQHGLWSGFQAELAFSAGGGGTATSGVYPITVVDDDTFTVEDTASGTITSGTVLRKFVTTRTGTYAQTGTTVTVTLSAHGLSSGDTVRLHVASGAAVDGVFQISDAPDANTFTVTAAAAAETSGNVTVEVGVNYGIFGIAMHPSGKWVYTTSTYECWHGSPLCWGDGLISRFAIDWNHGRLTFEKSFVAGRAGAAPVGITFSPDGRLLLVQDDELDGIDMWGVDGATGDLTLLSSTNSSEAYLHGLAFSSDGTRVYNGSNVYSVDVTPGAEALTLINSGDGANSCFLVNDVLYSANTASGWQLSTYSLTTPEAPALIKSQSTKSTNFAREIVVTSDGGRVVTAGFSGLKVWAFDGATFSPAVGAGSTEYIDGLAAWPGNTSGVQTLFRSLTANAAGDVLAAAYFTHDDDSDTLGGRTPSGVMLFTLAPDGSIARVANHDGATYSRAARFIKKP